MWKGWKRVLQKVNVLVIGNSILVVYYSVKSCSPVVELNKIKKWWIAWKFKTQFHFKLQQIFRCNRWNFWRIFAQLSTSSPLNFSHCSSSPVNYANFRFVPPKFWTIMMMMRFILPEKFFPLPATLPSGLNARKCFRHFIQSLRRNIVTSIVVECMYSLILSWLSQGARGRRAASAKQQ